MTIWILVLAVLFEGQIHMFHYGAEKPFEFPTKETCEAKLTVEKERVPTILKDGATLVAIKCIPREKDGSV